MDGIGDSKFFWQPKRFSYEKSACAKEQRHSDVYSGCSGFLGLSPSSQLCSAVEVAMEVVLE